jgi:leucyl aminopeptidase (aminopeptidase T)
VIERHDGVVTFTMPASRLSEFRVNEQIDLTVEGQHVTGKVTKAECGNNVAIIVVQLP